MKLFTTICMFSIFFSSVNSQHNIPQEIEQTLSRLEYAFNTSDTRNLKYVLPTSLRMRIEDSSYSIITDKYVMDKLHRYLAEKDSLKFKFTHAIKSEMDGKHTSGILPDLRFYGKGNVKETVYIASGKLFYVSKGNHENVEITVFIAGGVVGIDISRQPRGQVFFTSPYN